MTGIFDFVRDVTHFSKQEEFSDLVVKVLRKTVQMNKSKNFKNWLTTEKTMGRVFDFDDYDVDEFARFFDRFHNIDHRYHHKVFCDTSYRILYQFSRLFRTFPICRDNYIFARTIITLTKHVPSVWEYLMKYYNKDPHGIYVLKIREMKL